jgi:hypothetical protein
MDYLQWDAEVAVRMPFTAGLDFDIERIIYEGKDCVTLPVNKFLNSAHLITFYMDRWKGLKCFDIFLKKFIPNFCDWKLRHIDPLASMKNQAPAFKRESPALQNQGCWSGSGWIRTDFSLFKPNLINMNVHSATCSCSVELYKLWFTLADFFPNWNFRGVFSTYI